MRPEYRASDHALASVSDDPVPRRISGTEFDRMVEAGVFDPGERLELVDGEILAMSPIGDLHAAFVEIVSDALRRVLRKGHHVRAQNPLDLGDDRLYPDIVIVRGAFRDFMSRTPSAAETALVVEVSDTTLRYDRGEKARIYAGARIAEYWIVDVLGKTLEVRSRPVGTGRRARYTDASVLRSGSVRAPRTTKRISLDAILG